MNVTLRSAADFPRRAFTVDDVRRMIDADVLGEDERIELIEGELVMMAAKGYAHELIKSAVGRAIARAASDDVMVGFEMSIQLSDNTIVEPDIAVFPKHLLLRSAANFVQLASGSLSLAIEVAASSLAYDKGLKSQLYARHGVQEFWVIDANSRVTWVHTGPQGEGWSSIVEHGADQALSTMALPGLSIRLADLG
jgi:Uma2 family endonuclease